MTIPGTEHYREIADTLREAARACQFAGARKEILHLAARLESRADHLDRRAQPVTPRTSARTAFSDGLLSLGKAVLHPVACDQARGARGRGQGTETLAKLSGLPVSGACVSRLEA